MMGMSRLESSLEQELEPTWLMGGKARASLSQLGELEPKLELQVRIINIPKQGVLPDNWQSQGRKVCEYTRLVGVG